MPSKFLRLWGAIQHYKLDLRLLKPKSWAASNYIYYFDTCLMDILLLGHPFLCSRSSSRPIYATRPGCPKEPETYLDGSTVEVDYSFSLCLGFIYTLVLIIFISNADFSIFKCLLYICITFY